MKSQGVVMLKEEKNGGWKKNGYYVAPMEEKTYSLQEELWKWSSYVVKYMLHLFGEEEKKEGAALLDWAASSHHSKCHFPLDFRT